MSKKLFTVFKLFLFTELQKRGILPQSILPQPNKPGYYLWIYEDTPELHAAVTEITGGKHGNN